MTATRLTTALDAWGSPHFTDVLRDEIEQLDAALLPLQQGLTTGNYALDHKHRVMIISVSDDVDVIRAKAGIFYSGILAGCNCADDPTLVEEQNEYCEVQIEINKRTAETSLELMRDTSPEI